jgi:hypothetical protein
VEQVMFALPTNSKSFLRTGGLLLLVVLCGHFLAYKIVNIPLQFEMVLIFSLVLFYPILRKPSIGIYLLFLILPIIPFVRRLYYLLHQRPAIDPLIAVSDILITIIIIALYFVFREQNEQQKNVRITSRIVLIYFLYLVFRTFVFNILPMKEALMRFHFYGPAVLLFFIGSLLATNPVFLKRLWIITLGIGCLSALYGFKQLLFGYSEAEELWFSSISFTTLFIKGFARPFSIFQSPASFADYMQLSIIAVLILSSWKMKFKTNILFLLVPVFFFAALITSVRSNWIGILLSILLWLLILQIKGTRQRVIILIFIGVLFIFSQIFDVSNQYSAGINTVFSTIGGGFDQQHLNMLVTERTSALSNPFGEHSFLSRLSMWRLILTTSTQPINAFLGRGVGALGADSLYFTYLSEFGYPGIIFIIWFAFYTINTGFTLIDRTTSSWIIALAKGITLMNLVFAVINITGTHIHSFPGDVYYWFWNGVLIKLEAVSHHEALTQEYETAHYT